MNKIDRDKQNIWAEKTRRTTETELKRIIEAPTEIMDIEEDRPLSPGAKFLLGVAMFFTLAAIVASFWPKRG